MNNVVGFLDSTLLNGISEVNSMMLLYMSALIRLRSKAHGQELEPFLRGGHFLYGEL